MDITLKDKNGVTLHTAKKHCKEDITVRVETQEIEITPSVTEQVEEGLFNKVIVQGDANLVPENIKIGTNIFGVEGGFDAVDTRDANATINDIAEGTTAYVNNQKIKGTVPNNGELQYEPSDEEQTIPSGITSGGVIKATDITKLNEYEACLTLANSIDNLDDYTDTTATAEDILEGKIAYIKGERVVGTLKTTSILPFIELEYIESSDSKQYINTGVQALSTISAEVKVLTPTTDECMCFGAWNNNKGILFGQAASNWFGDECYAVATNDAWKNAPSVKFDGGWHTYKYNATTGKSSIDGVLTSAGPNSGRSENLYLFKTNLYGQSLTGMRISNCKIYNNEILIRDYIPVKRKVDGMICMYDKVYGEFAFNAGTGSFIAGPEMEG
jgi:hypothetical protein